jgi:protein SCO1/2
VTPASPSEDRPDETRQVLDVGFGLVLVAAVVLVALLVINQLQPRNDPVGSLLDPAPRAAPPLVLSDPDGRSLSLASLRGRPVLVFFGYTHCPDVCPTTIGAVGTALKAYGPDARAIFVTVDPERDTADWLREYRVTLPAGMVPLTGSAGDIAATAADWGVRYARVDEETGGGEYSMSHTADVFVVDGAGSLRARLPFGTDAESMTAVLRRIADRSGKGPSAGSTAPSAVPSPSVPPSVAPSLAPTPGSARALRPEIRSGSIWEGAPGPVILALFDGAARIGTPSTRVTAQLLAPDGTAVGSPVSAFAVQPPGVAETSFVVTMPIPAAGPWRLAVQADDGEAWAGETALTALDPGTTAAIGAPAPTAHTPTVDDVGGVLRAITTDPAPDPRLSATSTSDALAEHRPFVLVVDSPRFKVSPACGRAVTLARFLVERWPTVAFIHLEPLRYSVVADTAVLDGTLEDPTLTPVAEAWGIGGDPWGPRSMPWVFVVDGDGIVRAKYEGVVGSDDVDVILAALSQP